MCCVVSSKYEHLHAWESTICQHSEEDHCVLRLYTCWYKNIYFSVHSIYCIPVICSVTEAHQILHVVTSCSNALHVDFVYTMSSQIKAFRLLGQLVEGNQFCTFWNSLLFLVILHYPESYQVVYFWLSRKVSFSSLQIQTWISASLKFIGIWSQECRLGS